MSSLHCDLSVYLVTDTAQCGGVTGVIDTVAAAAAAGATLVQLRDSQLVDEDFVALGKRLREVLVPYDIPLIINDRVHLVTAIGAQGAHVGQSDMPVAQVRELLGKKAIIGLTANTPEQVRAAAVGEHSVIDYLGSGALHATMTKDGVAPIGVTGVAEVIAESLWPVCAIGGVTAADAAALRAIGCAGMSVVSAICGQPDVVTATRALVAAWNTAEESL
ncbi:MAG: thiamine phosphate synthase [Propionibacteriaceae bacterium]